VTGQHVRVVVLGGSAPATVQLIDAIAAWPADEDGLDRRPERLELVLHGRSERRLAAVADAAGRRAEALGVSARIAAQADLTAALTGADVVLNQIRAGGLEQRSADESFPHAFGLPGEETLGPGGFASAIRSVAALRPVWAGVARHCPGALLINLSNPAGIVTQAARQEFGLEVIAVCDSPLALLESVGARMAAGGPTGGLTSGLTGAALRARYVGMNHVGWYVPGSPPELGHLTDVVAGLDADVPRLHGALPGPYLRYYVHPDQMLAAQRGQPTRADTLRELASATLETFGRGEIPADWRRPAPWYALAVVPVIDAWLHGSGEPLILGLPNGARLPWLPDDVIVEGPAAFRRRCGPDALPVPDLPDLPRGILASHASYERLAATTLAAGLPGDDDLVRILLANPMVRDLDQARGLAAAIAARMTAYDPLWR
jgi:6-phospho-beta-glucosidase